MGQRKGFRRIEFPPIDRPQCVKIPGMSLRRLAAVVTLVLFALTLGDWPYTDEILDELNQHAQLASADASGICPVGEGSGDDGSHHTLDFQGQLSLQNVTPPSEGVWSVRSDLSDALFLDLRAPRPDFVWDALFRPPAA